MGLTLQGGGVTSHDGVETYVNLIVNSFSDIEEHYPQSTDLFRSFARHKQGSSNFGYAELDNDKRLFNCLSRTEAGLRLYNELASQAPLITVSNGILGNIENLKNIQIFKLTELEQNPLQTLDYIAKSSRLLTKKDKSTFLDKIENLSKIISLKPGFFGFSVNINAIIDEWIKKKREEL